MKKGAKRIIAGVVLIGLQIVSIIGSTKSGNSISLSFDSPALLAYDLTYLLSYCFVGIIGAALLISGIVASVRTVDKEIPPLTEADLEDDDEFTPTPKAVAAGLATIAVLFLLIAVLLL